MNELFLVVCGLVLGVVFFFFLCETLIRLERRKARYKSLRFKSSQNAEEPIYHEKFESPTTLGNSEQAHTTLLTFDPVNNPETQTDSNLSQVPKPVPVVATWTREDTAIRISYADRKADPWESKNGGNSKPVTSKKTISESPAEKDNDGITTPPHTPTGKAPTSFRGSDKQKVEPLAKKQSYTPIEKPKVEYQQKIGMQKGWRK